MTRRAAGFVIFRKWAGEIEFLLLKASYGSFHWSSPKGHVDPGEDDFTTALRETREEAGYTESDLNIHRDTPLILNYEVKGKPKTVVYWLAELKDAEKPPKLSDEHTDMKWLNKEDAKKTVGYKENQDLLDKFYNKILDDKL